MSCCIVIIMSITFYLMEWMDLLKITVIVGAFSFYLRAVSYYDGVGLD